MGKISGPLLDRIDVHLDVPAVPYRELRARTDGSTSARMREQVGDTTWGYTLLFGFIPLGSTTPPEVPVLDHIFLHAHDQSGWRTICAPLSREQQTRRKPGERWVHLGEITVH